MFLDLDPNRHWNDPVPSCRSCKSPIRPGDATERLNFAPHAQHRLEDMNGIYHAACAKPFLSLARAFDMLGRLGR